MGAFTGISGYMSLGLGAKAKPCAVTINENETLIVKDSECPADVYCVAFTH